MNEHSWFIIIISFVIAIVVVDLLEEIIEISSTIYLIIGYCMSIIYIYNLILNLIS